MTHPLGRRDFLLGAAALAASACARRAGVGLSSARHERVVLFQGDSITDNYRLRTDTAASHERALGTGYPLLVSAALLRDRPDAAWRFYNRGISGNKVPDLDARWQDDTIALRPDVLSILIGVNDYWHVRLGRYAGTVADYERGLDALLARTRTALPDVRLVVLEPFVLVTGQVDATWLAPMAERRAACRRVAEHAGATFVPLQQAFDDAAARTGPSYWLADGVHPTAAGDALIAQHWLRATAL